MTSDWHHPETSLRILCSDRYDSYPCNGSADCIIDLYNLCMIIHRNEYTGKLV